ncbi:MULTISPECIES: BsuBI/PstI family type II restriction endonuclease [Streptomyces]|uniref:BsuBI/PstI family type II restriction endonuclease n=1 Tax=Streptomyces TaxID=1883 RepID=UPI0013DCF7FC|nr:restriction endonuclease [Streptomyces sp. SID8016]
MTKEQQDKKLDEAKMILAAIGMPKGKRGKRTALVLLAMLNLRPAQRWDEVTPHALGVTPCMEWMAENYPDIPKGRNGEDRYAPNSREDVRRGSVYPLMRAGILVRNSDSPNRATNDQNTRYHPSDIAIRAIAAFKSATWDERLREFHAEQPKLIEVDAAERQVHRVPVTMPDGGKVDTANLSPGVHSELIKAVVERFGSQFTPKGTVVYLGDTGTKWIVNELDYLAELGVVVDPHGKMPDVVIHFTDKDWLVLVEAVTSTGPVDNQRISHLKELFAGARPGLVFVTAFPTRGKFRRFMADIAWETEVWIAEEETHMVHFNGERFLGPYGKAE